MMDRGEQPKLYDSKEKVLVKTKLMINFFFFFRIVPILNSDPRKQELAHVRKDIITGPTVVHTNSDTIDEKGKALSITNIEEENFHLTGALLDCERVCKCVGNIECHCTHPEEEAKEKMLNDVTKNFAKYCI